MDEGPLQEAVLAAINSVMGQKEELVERIAGAMRMEVAPTPDGTMSAAGIDRRIGELEQEFQTLFHAAKEEGGYLKYADAFKRITEEVSALKEKRSELLEQQEADSAAGGRIRAALDLLDHAGSELTEWDESVIRQLVDMVKVLSAHRILVCLRGGMEIEQEVKEARVKWCS